MIDPPDYRIDAAERRAKIAAELKEMRGPRKPVTIDALTQATAGMLAKARPKARPMDSSALMNALQNSPAAQFQRIGRNIF